MSRSFPNPWIRTNLIDVLKASSSDPEGRKKTFKNPAKIVQVINANDENRVLFISDKENVIAVFLTASVVEALKGSSPGHVDLGDDDDDDDSFSLKTLKNSFVKLEEYHYTTVLQTAGSRDVKTFSGLNIDLPLAIQATRITNMGGDYIEVVGAPVSINKDPRVKEILNKFNYTSLVDSLAVRQFPSKNQLPNDEGLFLLPPNYSDEYPLLLSHCVISAPQRQILDSIDTFDHSQIIKLQAEKRVKAKRTKVTRSTVAAAGSESNVGPAPQPEPAPQPVVEPPILFAGKEDTLTQLYEAVERAKGLSKQLPAAAAGKGGSTRSKASLVKTASQPAELSTQDFLLTQDHLHELADMLDSQVLLTQQFSSSPPAKAAPVPARASPHIGKPSASSASQKASSSSSSSSKKTTSAQNFHASSQDEVLTQAQIPPTLRSSSSSRGGADDYNTNRRKIGSKIAKHFPNHGWHEGEVIEYDHPTRQYYVCYLDGDRENIGTDEIQQHIDEYERRQISGGGSDGNYSNVGSIGDAPVEVVPEQVMPRPKFTVISTARGVIVPVAPVGEAPKAQLSLDKNIEGNLESIMKSRTVRAQTVSAPPTVPMPSVFANMASRRNGTKPASPAESSKKRPKEADSSAANRGLNTSRHTMSPETVKLLKWKKPRLTEELPLSPIAVVPPSPWQSAVAAPECPRPLSNAFPPPKAKAVTAPSKNSKGFRR